MNGISGANLVNALCVFAGGGAGALLRYVQARAINAFFNTPFAPGTLGTLFVNSAGALLIGFLMPLFDTFALDAKWRLCVITGFLGGYTTFSAYTFETVRFFLNGNTSGALLNIAANNGLCILFALLGAGLHKLLFLK